MIEGDAAAKRGQALTTSTSLGALPVIVWLALLMLPINVEVVSAVRPVRMTRCTAWP